MFLVEHEVDDILEFQRNEIHKSSLAVFLY